MKTFFLILTALASSGLVFLNDKNKKKSKEIKKKMLKRIATQKKINAIKEASFNNDELLSLLIKLIEDSDIHTKIGKQLSEVEINYIEKKLQLKLPPSYKIFLQFFGDGAYWLYNQDVNQIQNYSWLKDYRKNLGKTLQLNKTQINVDSLLSLMAEDSNGGAWCWLTSEGKNDNEYPLAYYINNKLHYRVENFTEWLKLLVENKGEVIRTLDIEEKLGLG